MELRTAYIGGLPLEAAADKWPCPMPRRATGSLPHARKATTGTIPRSLADRRRWRHLEQAMGRIIAAGLMRCEALLERVGEIEDPAEAADAVAALGDTMSKLRVAAKSFMPEVGEQAVAIDTLKAFAVLGWKRSSGTRHGVGRTAGRLRHPQEAPDCRPA